MFVGIDVKGVAPRQGCDVPLPDLLSSLHIGGIAEASKLQLIGPGVLGVVLEGIEFAPSFEHCHSKALLS